MQNLGGEAMLGFDHVANGELGEFHERLGPAVRGRGGDAITDGVYEDDEIAGAVYHLLWSDVLQKVLRLTTEPRGPKDGVGLFCVEFAERAVAEAEIVDDAAVLQVQVAQIGELLRAFGLRLSGLRRSRVKGSRPRQSKDKQSQYCESE